jgi:hypothetical protein
VSWARAAAVGRKTAARRHKEHSAAKLQTKAGGINRGIRETRGKQTSSRFAFRVFRVFRGLSLSRRSVAACEQSRLLQCKRAGPDVNGCGLRRQGGRRRGRLEARRHNAWRCSTIMLMVE